MPWVQLPSEVVLWHTSLQLHESLGCVSGNHGKIMGNLLNRLSQSLRQETFLLIKPGFQQGHLSFQGFIHMGQVVTTRMWHQPAPPESQKCPWCQSLGHQICPLPCGLRLGGSLQAFSVSNWKTLQKHPKAINYKGMEKAHLFKQIHTSMDR